MIIFDIVVFLLRLSLNPLAGDSAQLAENSNGASKIKRDDKNSRDSFAV